MSLKPTGRPGTGVYSGTVGVANWCDVAYDTANAAEGAIITAFNTSFAEL